MKVVLVQFVDWDKPYYFSYENENFELGEKVIVKTDLGLEIGAVTGFEEISDKEYVFQEEDAPDENDGRKIIKPVVRKASMGDVERQPGEEQKNEAKSYCIKVKESLNLPMKIVDAHFSYEGSRITFAFIADGRVDFRELVKDLTRHFNRTIRLQQIGIRDEAKICGDCGHCGKPLCCKAHLKDLISITSEMTDIQQCAHRGSDRVSGACGRLMCCLAYEQVGYEELAKRMPPMDAKVNVDGKKGIVVGHHLLKQSVDVKFKGEKGEEDAVVEIDLNRHKK